MWYSACHECDLKNKSAALKKKYVKLKENVR